MIRARSHAPGRTGLGLPGCKAAIVLAAVALACCASVRALDPSLDVSQYAHTSWKVRDGFTKGLIVAIAQSPDGYLWLGTEFGLVRFDGVRAVPWQPPTGQQLPSNYIQKLLFARDGTFWIGTLSGLASWKDGKLTTYPEMAGQQVFPLLEDHEGTIWAGGRTKLCSIRNARMDCYGGDGSLGAGVFGLYEDTRQNLWVGVPNGFWRWKPGPPKFFPAPSDTAGSRGLNEDDQHALLIGLKGGIRRFVNGHFEAHPLPYRGLTTAVQQIFRDRDGSLWIATLTHGLVHVYGGRVDTFSSSDGLSGDSVFDVREDREGNIWVATNDGLDRFRPYSIATISRSQGLGNTLTFSALAARDGRVWIATPSGLDTWDQGKISAFQPSNGAWKPDGTINGPAPNSLFEDSSGRIWVATLRRFGYLDDGRFVSVSGYPGGWVHRIAEGPPGHLWVASRESGLLELFQGKVVQQLSWPALGREQYANDLAVDPAQKGLWLGFWRGGLAYFAENKVQASYSVADGLGQGTVNQLRFDSHGTLWAATDGGLSRIKDGHITTLTSRNGLPCDVVHWTIEDNEHAVWLYTICGLVRIAGDELDTWAADAKKTINAKVLDASDGVRTHSWIGYSGSRPLVTKTKDGKIWFITSDGVSILNPYHLAINSVPPPVHIEQITADDKLYCPAKGLRLAPLVHYLTIDYTALSLAVPEKVRFRYKLEGVDAGWREVINNREVQYSNPPPGHYRFRVIAANNSGVWNEQGDTLEFDIQPTWYQTLWFRALCAVAFLLLLWSAYLLRVRHLRDQKRKLQDVIETIPAFVWTALPDGSVDFANHHWERFSGLSAEKTAGSGWVQALHPEDRERHAQEWRHAVSSGELFEIEVRFRGEKGEYRWFLVRAVPMPGPRGKITKWYGTATDIEDRKRAESRLWRSEAYLVEAQQLSHTGSFGWNISSGEIYWSPETFCIFGFDPTQKVTVDLIRERTHPEDRIPVRQLLERATEQKNAFDFEHRLLMPDGSVKYVHIIGRPSEDESGFLEFVGAVTDVSERKLAEQALRRSEAYLAEAQRLNRTGSWAMSPGASKAHYWSDEMCRIWGFDPQEGTPDWQVSVERVHPDDREAIRQAIEQVLQGHTVDTEGEFRLVMPDGTVRYIHGTAHPVLDQAGHIVEYIGTHVDVTERKRAEEALRRSEAYLAEAQKLSHTGSWAIRPGASKSHYWSEEMFRIYGCDPRHENPDWRVSMERVHPDDRDRVREYLEEVVEVRLTDDVEKEYRILMPDGTAKYIHGTVHPVFDEAGQVVEYIGTDADVTGRKRAEEALRRSEAYLAEAQRLSHTGSWALDLGTGKTIYYSEEMFRIMGLKPTLDPPDEEAISQRIHPEDLPLVIKGIELLVAASKKRRIEMDQTTGSSELAAILKELGAGRDVDEPELRVVLPDGTLRFIRSYGHPIFDKAGQLVEWVGTAIDVTEQKKAEFERERLRQLEADLAHMNRVSMMGEFAASLAHEIKQPIAAAAVDAGTCMKWLAREHPDLEEARQSASRMIQDAMRASEIVGRVRSLYFKGEPQRLLIDMNEIIREMIDLLSVETQRHAISIHTELADDLPNISADRVQLQQVLMNLMLNSVDAINQSDNRGRLTIKSRLDPDGQLVISVIDTGTGLPPGQADKIFDAFFTTKAQGTGMGLSISRSIIESHGGRLWATTDSEQGTTFHFTIPRAA